MRLPCRSRAGVRAEPHGAAEVAVCLALLELVAAQPLGQEADNRLGGRSELRRARIRHSGEGARCLDHGHLHPEADAKIRDLPLAGEARRADLAFASPRAEPAGHEDAADSFEERRRVFPLKNLALDPIQVDLDPVRDRAVV
jgi:hypothetical protein